MEDKKILCIFYAGLLSVVFGLDERAATVKTTPRPTKVCYGNLGCFTSKAPFDNTGLLPLPPDQIQPKIYLYTRANRNVPAKLNYSDPSTLQHTKYKADKPTKIIIHGFLTDITIPWMREMRQSLLNVGDFNVLQIGWGKGARNINYDQASTDIKLVGRAVVLVIRMMQKKGQKLSDVHLMGHSLGAQMSGYIGSRLGANTVGRITGLDPARPNFEGKSIEVRLDKTDAKYVDVIHSNGANLGLAKGGFGIYTAMGHVDFYPNGGKSQRGCNDGLSGILNLEFNKVACSHGRSHEYYLESIKSKTAFKAYSCHSYKDFENNKCFQCKNGCSQMGYYSDTFKARGSFYLDTTASSPFSGEYYQGKLIPGKASAATYGTLYIRQFKSGNKSHGLGAAITKVNGKLNVQSHEIKKAMLNEGVLKGFQLKYKQHYFWDEEYYAVNSVQLQGLLNGKKYVTCPGPYRLKNERWHTLPVVPEGSSCISAQKI